MAHRYDPPRNWDKDGMYLWQARQKGEREGNYKGLECEACQHFDLGTLRCAKDKRPRKRLMLDGPNPELHFHYTCPLFQFDSGEAIDRYLGV